MLFMPDIAVDPADVQLLQQVQVLWNSGDQGGAIETLRPRSEVGVVWAVALMSWLHFQQGFTGSVDVIEWAIRAAQAGAPWQVANVLNSALANLPAMPHLAEKVQELMVWATPGVAGFDPIANAWNIASQGQPEIALRIMSHTTQWPLSEPQLAILLDRSRAHASELSELAEGAREGRFALDARLDEATQEIEKAKNDLSTRAKQAGLLVTTILSDATNALYKADASRNEVQSKGAWRAGLVVLAFAALAAVMPVGLHYLNLGPDYSTVEVIGVHLASTAALGTFAGVLLARARARDHAAQRAYDLSTAMGTMISYSNQISNPVEKERFMMTMGQVIMQAHLSAGPGSRSGDDPMPGVLALVNALRSTNASASPPTG